jgi:hypothetical protein
MLIQFLQTGRGIAFAQMFAITEYPSDVMPLYAQGYSLSEHLIETGGRRKFVQFLAEGMKTNDWTAAIHSHYGFQDLGVLQNTWLAWVKGGSPRLSPPQGAPETQLAAVTVARPRPQPNLVLRVGKGGPMTAVGARPAVDADGRPQNLAIPAPLAVTSATRPSAYAVPQAAAMSGWGWHSVGTPPRSPQAQPTGPIREELSHPQPVVNGQ